MIVVVVSLDGGVLDRAVHPLDLAVGPRMIWLGEPMLDAVSPTGAVERMAPQHGGWTITVSGQVGELDAVIGENRMDDVGHGGDKRFEKGVTIAMSALSNNFAKANFDVRSMATKR